MIAQFALRLLFGMSLMWCLMPRSQVTSGFFRIQMLLALGLSVLAALTIGRLPASPAGAVFLRPPLGTALCLVLAAFAFCGSVVWTLERRRAGTVFVFLMLVGSCVALLDGGLGIGSGQSRVTETVLKQWHWLTDLSAGALLGGAVTGMLLGHWYLTAPTMSIAPLGRVNWYFGGAAVLRCVPAAIGCWLAWEHITGTTYGTWLALRWIAGIGGPLVAAGMVMRILKHRNTQAATGVLFAGVILTFIGELAAALLTRELHVPL